MKENLASQVQCGGFLRQLLYHLWGMSHAKQILLSFPSILVIVIILLNILFTPHVALLKPLTQSLLIDVPASQITSLHSVLNTLISDTSRTKIMPPQNPPVASHLLQWKAKSFQCPRKPIVISTIGILASFAYYIPPLPTIPSAIGDIFTLKNCSWFI